MFERLLFKKLFFHRLNQRLLPLFFLYLVAFFVIVVFGSKSLSALDKPENRYVPVNSDLELLAITPLDKPKLSDEAIANFFKKSIVNSLSLDWMNYMSQLTNASSRFYTLNGGKTYLQQVKKAGILDYIKDNQVWGVDAINNVSLIKKGLISPKGRKVYFWTMGADVVISRSKSNPQRDMASTRAATFSVKTIIVRQNELEFKDGVAVMQFYIEQAKNSN